MTDSYVDMLKEEYLDRKKRRPHYSERAFARDLMLSSGFISLLFNGKRSLSPRTSLKIIQRLNWSEIKSKKFMDSVQKAQFLETKQKTKTKNSIDNYELELDHFRLISNMRHFAVLELIQTRKVSSIEFIMEYFNLDKIECEMILKRLQRLGMINCDGKFYKASPKNRKLGSTPSEAIRNYHKQAIKMSLESIDKQEFSKRELRALTFSIDVKKIKQAKASIDKFIKEFSKKYGNTKNGEIYQMNIQLFGHRANEGDGK